MHRTDDDANVSNRFDPGDPLVPRQPTQVSADWLNAVQEELIKILVDAGVTPVKGTWDQVRTALTVLYVDKASAQTIAGAKSFSADVQMDQDLNVDGSVAVQGGLIAQGYIDGITGLSTGGDVVAGGNVTATGTGSTIPHPTPTNLTLNAGVAANSGFGGPGGITPCVWRDAFGVYHLEGSIVAASSSSYVAATGPAPATGKRSSYGNRARTTGTDRAIVTLMENGDIQVDTNTNGIVVDLSGITYR